MSSLPEIWEKEIINIKGEVDWVLETSEQLIKDFNMLNIPLQFHPLAQEPYSKLFSESKRLIKDLYENDFHSFLNLLYRVDLNEAKLHELANDHSPTQIYDQIAELILKREFMKVVYRHRYSV